MGAESVKQGFPSELISVFVLYFREVQQVILPAVIYQDGSAQVVQVCRDKPDLCNAGGW